MKGIHCFSTRPMLQGRDISGHAKQDFKMLNFPDYALGTLLFSAAQWRKTNGPIKLYTDSVFYEYLAAKGVLGFWDEVSCELDNIDEKFPGIDHAIFWSAAKFYCYTLETAPFACVDTDIIVWSPLEQKVSDCALAFTHYESIEPGDDNYVSQQELTVAKSYRFLDFYDSVRKGLNMSLTVFMDEEFKQKFTAEAISFMQNSPKKYDRRYATPEILYMEQILPVQFALRDGYTLKPLIDCTWSPKQFCFLESESTESWIFNSFNQQQLCMHLWFHKNYIDHNQPARNDYMTQLSSNFKKNFPALYPHFIAALNR